jgi:uncharacterized protein YcbX
MAHVRALYRYPVKGFTPESCDRLTVLPEGRIAGDRVLAFRFADTPAPDDTWSKKYGHAVLVNTPALARLRAAYDASARRLRIELDGTVLADEALDRNGRERLAQAVQRYVLGVEVSPLAGRSERLPLRLIGDGVTARYADSERGEITLHGRESVTELAAALGAPGFDERRFRSNIAIEGAGAWAELGWIGRTVRIGSVEFDVVKTKIRCLATHANPGTGKRDLEVMQTLVRTFGHDQPTFAAGLITRGAGGEIRVGDDVEVA